MYHPHLKKLIAKHLADPKQKGKALDALLKEINQSYYHLEKEKKTAEKTAQKQQKELQSTSNQLKKLNADLDAKIQTRTKELEEMSLFPMANPNPIFRIRLNGEVVLQNPAASRMRQVEYQGKKYPIKQFLKKVVSKIRKDGSFDLTANNKRYLFTHKYLPAIGVINIYAADVNETHTLRVQLQDNLTRLRNFLETTDDAYFIIYANHPEKNVVTSRWHYFFGFDLQTTTDLFADKANTIVETKSGEHRQLLRSLKVGDRLNLRYQAKHKISGQTFWLSEVVTKQYDIVLDDIVISGRITDVTKEQEVSMKVQESEQRFRSLIDAAPMMIWVSNEKNLVTYSNKAMKAFLGYDLEQMNDYNDFMKMVHPDDRQKAIFEWNKQIRKRKIMTAEFRIKGVTGKYHTIYEKAVPRFYSNGQFAGYIGAYFDLTIEKEYQQNLSLEKQKLEILTKNSPDVIFLLDDKGRIEYVSPTAKRILGYKDVFMIGKPFFDFMCKECYNQLTKMNWLKSLKTSQNHFEYRMQKKSGALIWMESSIRAVQEGGKNKILMYNRDINQAKIAEFALTESEQKYRGLFENMQLGVLEVDLNDKIQWANKSFEKILGYSFSQLKGKTASTIFLADPASLKTMQTVKRTRTDKRETIYEIQMKRKNGESRDVVISGSPIIDFEGKVKGSVGIHWDVTEIRKLERMVEEEKTSRQRAIMKATISAEEKQREQIGHELHDEVGHVLTYTSLFLQMLTQNESVRPEQINKAHQQVEHALKELKRISRNLVPPALVDLGLKEAIIELFNQYTELRGLQFDIRCNPAEFSTISMDVKKNLYRMIQELVSNTHKHAKARSVRLTIRKEKDKIQLEYFNDGKTFNPTRIKKGAGFESIQNRVYFYNGTFQLFSNRQDGNRFVIELPLKNILQHD